MNRPGGFASFDLLGRTRIAVAVLNFPLAYLSYRNPSEPDWPVLPGFAGCALFLAWAVASYFLHRRVRTSDVASTVLTLADILAAGGLVAVTGGALSPFGSWISFMALGTAYVSRQRYAVVIALAAVATIFVIGTRDHSITSLTIVRASWAATFALFGFLVRAAQASHLRLLSALETFTAEVGTLTDDAAAMEAFRQAADAIAQPSNVVVRLERLGLRVRPRLEPGDDWLRVPIVSGSHDLGEAHFARPRKFTADERMALQLAGERLASALLRMEENRELIDEAVRQERLALADELHDTTIQTLTALDLGAAILQRQLKDNPEAREIAAEIGAQARDHIAHVRRFLRDTVTDRVPGPESLGALLEERWSGPHELDIPPGTRLSEARWRLVGLMAREGLNNAARHGGASQVRLVVRAEDDGFEARLEADGASPPEEPRAGYGLSRLRAVASAQRASVDLRPGEGGGSVLAVRAREEDLL